MKLINRQRRQLPLQHHCRSQSANRLLAVVRHCHFCQLSRPFCCCIKSYKPPRRLAPCRLDFDTSLSSITTLILQSPLHSRPHSRLPSTNPPWVSHSWERNYKYKYAFTNSFQISVTPVPEKTSFRNDAVRNCNVSQNVQSASSSRPRTTRHAAHRAAKDPLRVNALRAVQQPTRNVLSRFLAVLCI